MHHRCGGRDTIRRLADRTDVHVSRIIGVAAGTRHTVADGFFLRGDSGRRPVRHMPLWGGLGGKCSRVNGLVPGLLRSGSFHIECQPRRLHERRVFFSHSRFVDGRKAMHVSAYESMSYGSGRRYFGVAISRTTSCMRARYRFWLGSRREAISSSPRASSSWLRAIRQAARE